MIETLFGATLGILAAFPLSWFLIWLAGRITCLLVGHEFQSEPHPAEIFEDGEYSYHENHVDKYAQCRRCKCWNPAHIDKISARN